MTNDVFQRLEEIWSIRNSPKQVIPLYEWWLRDRGHLWSVYTTHVRVRSIDTLLTTTFTNQHRRVEKLAVVILVAICSVMHSDNSGE